MGIWGRRRGRLRHSVGIETKGGRFTRLIPKGEPLVYVTFHVDAQGKLSITAQEDGTGRDLPVLRR